VNIPWQYTFSTFSWAAAVWSCYVCSTRSLEWC